MNKRLVIMRGISGSGKSTYTRDHLPGAYVCSADQFFIDPAGVYQFDPRKLGEAHRWCYRSFLTALSHNHDIIVVDNTNTQLFEFYGYAQAAWAHDYTVEVVRMDTPVEVAAARNLHGVPTAGVKAMQDRFQTIPPFLGITETVIKGV